MLTRLYFVRQRIFMSEPLAPEIDWTPCKEMVLFHRSGNAITAGDEALSRMTVIEADALQD